MSRLSKFNAPILASPDPCADDRKPFRRARSWLKRIAIAAAFSAPPLALAIAPTLPIRFEAVAGESGQWTVGVVTNTEQIGPLRVEKSLYANGRQLRVEVVAVRPETGGGLARGEARVRVPLRFREMGELQRTRYFAEKIVVQGQWREQSAGPALHVQRWYYFRVANGEATPVTVEEYAAITDPAEPATDSSGRRTLIHRGAAVRADVPLPDTRGSPDQPITPQETVRATAPQPQADLSERHER